MILLPSFDPVAFALGPVEVRWYGLSYLIGVAAAILLGRRRAVRDDSPIPPAGVIDAVALVAIATIIGGRLGYALFYQFEYYAVNPVEIIKVWRGGMSFHGGVIGAAIGIWAYARRSGVKLLRVSDFLAPLSAVGLFFGRVANFVNQELWGRETDLPWSVVFPADPAQLARHPSQLYEAALEGIVLFAVLWAFSMRRRPVGSTSGLFLVLYGVFRFVVEFTREPDAHLQFIFWNWATMGQLLSVPLIAIGLCLLFWKPENSGAVGKK